MTNELTPHQIADALRECGSTIVCEGCPYGDLGTPKCIQAMQRDAAELIEELSGSYQMLLAVVR